MEIGGYMLTIEEMNRLIVELKTESLLKSGIINVLEQRVETLEKKVNALIDEKNI